MAQDNVSGTMAVDDPAYYSPSWTEADEDLLIQTYITAIKTKPQLSSHYRIFIWNFIDKSGELINTEHFKQRLQAALTKAFPNKLFFFKGYGSLIIHGQIEMNLVEADGVIYKNYTVWLKAINSDIPMKQVWSKAVKFTHSQVIPGYSVGFIEDAK